ncbi:phosphoglycerate dehydrogenase [Virgibacillus ndiopensis]|uniref:phosphoglycerate dehydrogenase n=1 Tax=Virgibacillus ndiopensis TaxID=2004408 RepID=UPI000C0790FB|nr:phosphoglycerate dehydrogenase [Virgibacillus ndiopensis]
MYKVLISSRMFGKQNDEPLNLIKKNGCEVVDNPYQGSTLNQDQLIELIEGVDAAIVGDDYFSKKVIEKANKLKVISKYGVGTDRIDVEAATKKGIVVTNTPGSNKDAVADMVFTLMLSISRQIFQAVNVVQRGEWKVVIGHELSRKTLGIIGLGRIGKEVAVRAQGFNMEILAFDPHPDKEFIQSYKIKMVDLQTLLSTSDFVTLHLPSLLSTKGMLDKDKIHSMKKDAFLINTARGDIIDELALYNALKERKIAGAALDTLQKEPPSNNPILTLDNVIVTPHIGGHSYESNYNMGMASSQNIIKVLNGEKPLYSVN